MIMNKKGFFSFFLLLYIISSLILPTFFLNKICFAIIMLVYICTKMRVSPDINGPFVLMVIFSYGFLLSFFSISNMTNAIQFFLCIFSLMMIYPICNLKMDIERLVELGGLALLFTDFLFILYAAEQYGFKLPFGIGYLSEFVCRVIPNSFFDILIKYSETAVGSRGFGGNLNPMIHIGTIPFLYLPTCLWFEKGIRTKKIRYYILVMFSLFVILISTSRALLMMVCVILFFLLIDFNRNIDKKICLSALFVVLILVSGYYMLRYTTIFSSIEGSNSVKIGHVKSVFKETKPFGLVFGNGLASYYFSSGVGRLINHTEITFFDHARYFGFPLASLLYFKLLFPMRMKRIYHGEKKRIQRRYFVIFFGYLLISLTNPVLMNSMGIIVVLWYWNKEYLLIQNYDSKSVEV